ncbi:hypothetical protein [uncultured Tenacibaculum sp.]|uniref:hypothetical protein n=1 Tax=uncultured Tenacibaculum sp. TaxID=174713 RepID=UPI00262BC7E5|nr:hypothetical protein [uncultured Tenacibaculum sp.]
MIKSISNIGTLLTKKAQQSIKGGGPGDPNWCRNRDNWGPKNRHYACHQNQEAVYDPNVGHCVCKDIAYDL